MTSSSTRAGAAMVVAAAVLWGTLGSVFKVLDASGTSPVVIGFWRALLAGLAILAVMAAQGETPRIERRDVPFFLAYGFVSVTVFFAVYPLAVRLSGVTLACVLLYTAPAWVVLLGALVLGEPVTPRRLAAVVLTFMGCALVAQAHDASLLGANVWGVLAGLASGLTYATLGIFGRPALRRYPPTTVTATAMLVGAAFLVPVALWQQVSLQAPWRGASTAMAMTYAGLVPTAMSFLLYVAGLQRLGDAGRASLLATVEPLVSALFGFALWHEALAPLQWLGAALIVSGVMISARDERT